MLKAANISTNLVVVVNLRKTSRGKDAGSLSCLLTCRILVPIIGSLELERCVVTKMSHVKSTDVFECSCRVGCNTVTPG